MLLLDWDCDMQMEVLDSWNYFQIQFQRVYFYFVKEILKQKCWWKLTFLTMCVLNTLVSFEYVISTYLSKYLNAAGTKLESCKGYKERTQSQVYVILDFVRVVHHYTFRTSKRWRVRSPGVTTKFALMFSNLRS